MKINFIRAFLFFIATLCIYGCMSTEPKRTYQGPDQVVAPITMNSIVFVDHSLNQVKTKNIFGMEYFTQDLRVSVQNMGIRSAPAGAAEVWVMLKNHTSYAVQIEGRTQFFDQSKAPSEEMSAWQRVYVPANSSVTYKELAIKRSSSYYQIEFREGL